MKQKILIVEDEPEIVTLITNRIDSSLYKMTVAHDGNAGLTYIRNNQYDLVVLDIMLPSVDGFTLCNEVRKNHKDTLIVIISALDIEEKKIEAYRLGADDYISKPFSPKLLALKIDTLLKRRFEMTYADTSADGILIYHKALKRFYVENRELSLTLSEFTILETLFLAKKRVFSKGELSQILYDEGIGSIDEKGIATHIYTLRKKIARYSEQELIKTVRGIGYTLHG